ncbi:hypothetical protein AMECASPLE_038021 [Ameca splendens]|uniref:Secreted protein n=1 Tax=Ameca splendens TaxID=208324 RepID=A0ABV0Z5X7_9TELE
MSSIPSLPASLILIPFMPLGFHCSALPTSDILLASNFWTSTLLLPPDYCSLPNPCVHLPESASLFMTLLRCPDQRFKLLSWILLPDSAFPALTEFPSPDYHTLLTLTRSTNLRAHETFSGCHWIII